MAATMGAIHESYHIIAPACETLKLDPVRLLKAIAHKESTCGTHIDRTQYKKSGRVAVSTRHEKSYSKGGRYYTNEYSDRWGKLAESSHGPFQVMYENAVRYGFPKSVDPADLLIGLANPYIATDISCKMMSAILSKVVAYWMIPPYFQRGALDMVADAWNSGSFKDRFRPVDYINAVKRFYSEHSDNLSHP